MRNKCRLRNGEILTQIVQVYQLQGRLIRRLRKVQVLQILSIDKEMRIELLQGPKLENQEAF